MPMTMLLWIHIEQDCCGCALFFIYVNKSSSIWKRTGNFISWWENNICRNFKHSKCVCPEQHEPPNFNNRHTNTFIQNHLTALKIPALLKQYMMLPVRQWSVLMREMKHQWAAPLLVVQICPACPCKIRSLTRFSEVNLKSHSCWIGSLFFNHY